MVYWYAGRITTLLIDFKVITISEIAGLDNDIALAPISNSTLDFNKIDMHTPLIEFDEPKSNLNRHPKRPLVK